MNRRSLYDQHQHELEDFWGRRSNGPRAARDFLLFGRAARMTSNDERILGALDFSLPLFSEVAPTGRSPFSLHVVVREMPVDPGPFPEDGFSVCQYSGYGPWLAIQVGAWGHCQIDRASGSVLAVLAPQFAERPDAVSRFLLNTVLLNLIDGAGFAMLHCTALRRAERLLLLMAPHNSGKSTTALRLVMAGYQLLSDSQIYVSPDHEELLLAGFPVGRARLRGDMVAEFPHLRPYLDSELVRGEPKYTVDLRRLDPGLVYSHALRPERIELCLLSRANRAATSLQPATREEVMEAAFHNSTFYDDWEHWERNLALIERCVDRASWRRLAIGTEPEDIVRVVDELMGGQ